MAKQQQYTRTYIREWRKAAGKSLDDLADACQMDKGNLSKLERGLLAYNQVQIERIARELQTSVIALLTRLPDDPTPIWDYIGRADPVTVKQIEAAAEAIYNAREKG